MHARAHTLDGVVSGAKRLHVCMFETETLYAHLHSQKILVFTAKITT